MKSIIKFLFVLIAAIYTASIFLYADDVIVKAIVSIAFMVFVTGLVVPARYFSNGHLNVITDMKAWQKYIIEKLRRTNDWLVKSSDASASVLGGAVVYIPQAGADPTIEVNTFVYPGVAVVRTDSDVNYALDYYRTVPSHVPWAELQTISYDKIDSVVKGHTNSLAEAVGDVMLTKWAATVAGQQIATTGADVDPVGTQVGVRKGLSHKDLITAMIRMNAANVPKKNRVALIDDNMFGFFYDELTASQMNAFQQFANNETGQVGRLHGFDIYTRSSVLAYAAASLTPNAYAAAIAATDNLASLCWQADMVERAVGETKPFQSKDDPLYYGDIWSMILRCGGRKKRADNVGVISIIQGV